MGQKEEESEQRENFLAEIEEGAGLCVCDGFVSSAMLFTSPSYLINHTQSSHTQSSGTRRLLVVGCYFGFELGR
jgi:hypothetical protein